MGKASLLINTVRHLKVKQIVYQVSYRLFRVKPLSAYKHPYNKEQIYYLTFSDFLPDTAFAGSNVDFEFLNQQVSFKDKIDWNYMNNGKLWNYNLHYGNYLLQESLPLEIRLSWLSDLHNNLYASSKGLEPYPVSLRIINTVQLICRHKLDDKHVIDALSAETNFLSKRVEYHLLGNHVLENGFALIMGGAFFHNNSWVKQGHEILANELKEQILTDGAHFELSPMYHQIILYRVLELIEWYQNWSGRDKNQLHFYQHTAAKMLSWLDNMTFKNGDIPHFNDSANGIAYTTEQLFNYSNFLNIKPSPGLALSQSGYRKFSNHIYECVVDVAAVGPTYQPGHAHADALSFILYADNKPVLVESGTSTYQPDEQRQLERATSAHNTVTINNYDQSEVWGGFRVGKRAVVSILNQTGQQLEAEHNGYKDYNIIHNRRFIFEEKSISITDSLKGSLNKNDSYWAYFHLHPEIEYRIAGTNIYQLGNINLSFLGAELVEIKPYTFSDGFNNRRLGKVLCVKMSNNLITTISFN